jgi:HNH endonuclease
MAMKTPPAHLLALVKAIPADDFEQLFSLSMYTTRNNLEIALAHFLNGFPDSGFTVFECWPWLGRLDDAHYGRFGLGFGTPYVNRIIWTIVHRKPVPKSLEVDHRCHVRRCVNPFHLEAVPKRVNLDRRRPKPPKQACKYGHPRRQRASGTWYCPTCLAAAMQAWRDKDGNRERENAARNARR